MNKKILVGIICVMSIGLAVTLSGCESSTPTVSGENSRLQGTWQGSLPLSMSRGNSTVTQIRFSGNTAMMRTISVFGGDRTMNYTFNVSSGTLVFHQAFGDGFGRPGNGTMPNGTRPPGNWTWPGNGTRPNWNGSRPDWNGSNWTWPQNGTQPWNGTRPPGNRSQFSFTLSYRFDGDTTLYLNNVAFTKVS